MSESPGIVNVFLTSTDSTGLRGVRLCSVVKRFRDELRDDYFLTVVEPPLNPEDFGLPIGTLDHIVICTKHEGVSLVDVLQETVHVYVSRLKTGEAEQGVVSSADIECIAWGEIHRTRDVALLSAQPESPSAA